MRFLRAEIFGFGKWIDAQFSFEDHPFIYFYGDNEAGKSTLQQFLLYILFGLPPKQLSLYKPKQSNFLGGTLTLTLGEEVVTIERVEQRVRFLRENGIIEEDPNWLQEQLHGLTRDIYEQIYAFSALDLTELHKVKENELSDLLFSIGLTGSGAIYDVERKITIELDRLFKKTGRVPKINEQLIAIDELQKNVYRAKEEAASYNRKQQVKEHLTEQLRTLKEQISQLEQTYILNQKIMQALPLLNEYRNKQQLLANYRDDLIFPENGIERYESLKYEWIPLHSEQKTIKETMDTYREKIEQLQQSLLNVDIYNDLENLLAEQSRIDEIKVQLHHIENNVLELQTLLDERLHIIGLTEAEVRAISLPFHLASTWKQLIDEGRTLQIESEQLTTTYEQIVSQEETLTEEFEQLQNERIDDEKLNELAHKLQQTTQIKREVNFFTLEKRSQINNFLLQQLPLLVTFIAFISLLFFSFLSKQMYVIGMTLVLFLLVVLQVTNYMQHKKRHAHLKKQKMLLLDDREIELIRQQLNEQERLKVQLQYNEQASKQLNMEKMKWEERKRAFSIREHKWITRVNEEQKLYPFLQKTDIEHWLDLLHHLQQMKQWIVEKDKLTKRKDAYAVKVKEHNEKFARLNKVIKTSEEQLNPSNGQKWLNEAREKQQTLAQLTKMLEEGQLKQKQLTEQMYMLEIEMEALFQYANVTTEEQYFQVAKQVLEKEQLEKDCQQLYEQLKTFFPEDERNTILKKVYHATDLEKEMTNLKYKIEQLKDKLLNAEREITKIQLEIAQLESSEAYSYYVHLYEVEREKLNALANEWAVIKLAKEALQRAKQAYKDKYLTNILQQTTYFFNRLTNGTYINVYPPTKHDSFQVEGNNKLRYTVEELSKGTVDQLYVALRLAISKVMSDTYRIPMMIDDAFVHFDKQRAKEAILLLREIATEQQVIFFTCHEYGAFVDDKHMLAVNI